MSDAEARRPVRLFEVVYVVVLLALLVLSVFFMNPHRVGVLDVVRVARELGLDKRIAAEMKDEQDLAGQQIQVIQRAFERRASELDQKMRAGSPAERESMTADLRKTQEQAQRDIGALRGEVRRHEALLLGSFRRRLQPVVDAVARKRRLDLVVEPSVNVLYVRRKVDVTDEVVARARRVMPPNLPLIDPSLTNAVSAVEPQ